MIIICVPLAQFLSFYLMFNRFSICVTIAVLSLASLCSCSSDIRIDNTIAPSKTVHLMLQNDAYYQLLSDIQSLNADFGISETKGLVREMAVHAADVFGAWAGKTLGISAGAAITLYTGSPHCGYLLGRLAAGALGVAGYVSCSYLAGLLYDYIQGHGGREVVISPDDPFWNIIHGNQTAIQLDTLSLGEIHNYMLYALRHNGKTYMDKDGNISVEEMYEDAVQIAADLGICDLVASNLETRISALSFCHEVMNVSSLYFASDDPVENYYSSLMQRASSCVGRPLSELEALWPVINELVASASLSNEETIAYERAFEAIVFNSGLSEEAKEEVAVVGSVAIMSIEYWDIEN